MNRSAQVRAARRVRPSRAQELAYADAAAPTVDWLRRALKRALRGQRIATDAAAPQRTPYERALAAIADVRLQLVSKPPKPPDLAPVAGSVVVRVGKGARATLRGIGQVAPVVATGEAGQVAGWLTYNVSLIESLAPEGIDRLERILVTQLGQGARVETIAKVFEGQLGVTQRKARLLARDQVAKLGAAVNADEMLSVGMEEYRWLTSEDERVRPSHAALDGQVFRFDAPPVVDPKSGRRENPGGDYQCRCVALPVEVGTDRG